MTHQKKIHPFLPNAKRGAIHPSLALSYSDFAQVYMVRDVPSALLVSLFCLDLRFR